ncbi:hypothetical protein [Limosilactobacillus fermentum]|nr:hypothetical protein [Limosilactobacillus fermentum]MCO8301041.1 hypothetical protein [Limosilactobacillus fermentum]
MLQLRPADQRGRQSFINHPVHGCLDGVLVGHQTGDVAVVDSVKICR